MFWPRIAISLISVCAIIARLLFPDLKIDSITLGLLIVAILPWLSPLIESAEFPGGWKIKFRDIQKAVETASAMDVAPPSLKERESPAYYDVMEQDPGLGLIALRIEIEKRVRELARKHRISEHWSSGRMLEGLTQRGILEAPIMSGLNDLIAAGNRAAHGAKVDNDVSALAAKAADKFLYFLDRKINQA